MVIVYYKMGVNILCKPLDNASTYLLQDAVWIDLFNPTKEEEHLVEQKLGLDIPTREEVQEIEPSSRLYSKNEIIYTTATMVALSNLPQVTTDAVSFILFKNSLITLRYSEFQAFKVFSSKLLTMQMEHTDVFATLLIILDAAIDRLADIIENISHHYDVISQLIFRPASEASPQESSNYTQILQLIGSHGDLGNKASESLMSFVRLLSYLNQSIPEENGKALGLLKIAYQDVQALREHASFLATKFNFLLDATLGMINIEQNSIIKIFSVAAVIFLPPTLIASIYGMNFQFMPELQWYIGYPVALSMMCLSAWLPFRYFKRKKWL